MYMKCNHCGAKIVKDQQFCSNCGSSISFEEPKTRFSRPPESYEGPKKLYRSRKNRMIAGVCGGLGEYAGIDPNLVRVLWVLFTLLGGTGLLAYIIAVALIPESPFDPWGEPE